MATTFYTRQEMEAFQQTHPWIQVEPYESHVQLFELITERTCHHEENNYEAWQYFAPLCLHPVCPAARWLLNNSWQIPYFNDNQVDDDFEMPF